MSDFVKRALHLLLLGVYCVYLYFFYHLLMEASFAEFSVYALLWVPVLLFGFWLVPSPQRRKALVYTLLFIFIDQAIHNVFNATRPLFFYYVAFIGLFLFPITRWYARIRFTAFLVVFLAAFLFNLALPNNIVQALPHLYLKWSSDTLYTGEIVGDFPLTVKDIDHDGTDEIITLGNLDKYPGGERKRKIGYLLEDEPLTVLVWKWKDGHMVRVPNDSLDPKQIQTYLREEYIGFPYYTLDDQFVLHPLVQKQPLSEGMMQFGTAPFRALLTNVENLGIQLEKKAGIYDQLEQTGDFTHVILQDGFLSGSYSGQAFRVPSAATKIIGSIQLKDKKQGLLVLGLELQLLQMKDGQLVVTHVITRDMQVGLAQSRFIITDVNGDGVQELVVAYPFSKILTPNDKGGWDMLWNTNEKSFRIKEIGSFAAGAGARMTGSGSTSSREASSGEASSGEVSSGGTGSKAAGSNETSSKEILALSKSAVRANDVTYLTSLRYSPKGLVQNWKIFLRNVSQVSFGDLDKDGDQELITTIFDKHKVYVWGRHHVPVTGILIGLTLLLLGYLGGRRFSHAFKTKKSIQF